VTMDVDSAKPFFLVVKPGMSPADLTINPHDYSVLAPADITLIEIVRP
jgi:hypothetical protein